MEGLILQQRWCWWNHGHGRLIRFECRNSSREMQIMIGGWCAGVVKCAREGEGAAWYAANLLAVVAAVEILSRVFEIKSIKL